MLFVVAAGIMHTQHSACPMGINGEEADDGESEVVIQKMCSGGPTSFGVVMLAGMAEKPDSTSDYHIMVHSIIM